MLKSTLPALNLVLAFDACDQALSLQAPEDSNTTANNAKVTSKNQRAFDHANRTAALVGHSIPVRGITIAKMRQTAGRLGLKENSSVTLDDGQTVEQWTGIRRLPSGGPVEVYLRFSSCPNSSTSNSSTLGYLDLQPSDFATILAHLKSQPDLMGKTASGTYVAPFNNTDRSKSTFVERADALSLGYITLDASDRSLRFVQSQYCKDEP